MNCGSPSTPAAAKPPLPGVAFPEDVPGHPSGESSGRASRSTRRRYLHPGAARTLPPSPRSPRAGPRRYLVVLRLGQELGRRRGGLAVEQGGELGCRQAPVGAEGEDHVGGESGGRVWEHLRAAGDCGRERGPSGRGSAGRGRRAAPPRGAAARRRHRAPARPRRAPAGPRTPPPKGPGPVQFDPNAGRISPGFFNKQAGRGVTDPRQQLAHLRSGTSPSGGSAASYSPAAPYNISYPVSKSILAIYFNTR